MSKSKTQPTARSLHYLRNQGYRAEVCEKYVARVEGKGQQQRFAGGYRKDLFGFMDILAFGCGEVVVVQCTTKQQLINHLRQYRRSNMIAIAIVDWLDVGRFELHGWWREAVKNKDGNGSHVRWRCEVRDVTPELLIPTERDVAWMVAQQAKET